MEAVMNRTRRLRRTLARRASSPGRAEPQASQPQGQEPHPAGRPGHEALAAQFTQELAAGPSVVSGQNRPTLATANSGRRAMAMPRLLPYTIQLCIHCRHHPAGFWVSRSTGQTVRRPWCLSCCQDLDPRRYHVQPFDS
jgi:hypothetical protein